VLERVPTGRLVVLGEPGAGKTVLAVRLVLDLLIRRRPGCRVPVLVPLASWDPAREHVWDWLERRLCLDHPALRASAGEGGSWARALWDADLILPVLDGLDEIAGADRGQALAQLNEALRPGGGVVLTARSDPYRAAVHSGDSGVGTQLLSGAAGVQLCPLNAGVVGDYLRAAAGGLAGQSRWDRALAALAVPSHPLAQALATPLMATLARTVHCPRPGEPTAGVPHPDELLDARFDTRAAVERHLFDGFVPAAYRPHPDPAKQCPWKPADARRWLTFLASHLEHRLGGTTDLAWWQLHTEVPRLLTPLAFGLAGGLLFGLVFGLVSGLVFGFVFGITAGSARGPAQPGQGLRWSPIRDKLRLGLGLGLAVGLTALWSGLRGGLGLMMGLAVGPLLGLATGLGPLPVEPAKAAGPRTILGRDRAAFRSIVLTVVLPIGLAGALYGALAAGLGPPTPRSAIEIAGGLRVSPGGLLIGGLGAGLAVGLRAGLSAAFVVGLATGVATGAVAGAVTGFGLGRPLAGLASGLTGGLVLGLWLGLSQTAWAQFAVARCWLALRGRLPWRLMRFLADAHQHRGVLRQAGAAYQFRHAELQRHLASGP
jgi:hypothetical protein